MGAFHGAVHATLFDRTPEGFCKVVLLRGGGAQGEVRQRKIVRPKDLSSLAGSRSHLWNLARAGKIERIGRGLYRDGTSPVSDSEVYVELAKQVPQGVLCLSSALRYHELTTENPSEIWLAIERGAWTPKIEFPPVRIAHFSKPAFDFGVETHPLDGVGLRVYSPAPLW